MCFFPLHMKLNFHLNFGQNLVAVGPILYLHQGSF